MNQLFCIVFDCVYISNSLRCGVIFVHIYSCMHAFVGNRGY